MMENVQIHKSVSEDDLFNDGPFDKWHAWCDLIFEAYFGNSSIQVRGITYASTTGSIYGTTRSLAKRWKWSTGKVQRFLRMLETEGKVTVTYNPICCITVHETDQYRISGNEATAPIVKQPAKQPDVPVKKTAPKKTSVKKPPTLVTLCREVFESKYLEMYNSSYYWSAKDAANMSQLVSKIKYARQGRNKSIEDEDIKDAFGQLLNSIVDEWILKNFSVPNINNKYNEIVAQAAKSKTIQNGTDGTDRTQRQQDAYEIAQQLAANGERTTNEVF